MHSGRRLGLGLLIAWVTGCSSSGVLDDACIPGLSCKTHLELIEEPAGCSTCSTCADDWGSCKPGGFACKQGQLDLSADGAGCEMASGDVNAQYVARSTGDSVGTLSVNQDTFDAPITVTTIAFDADVPACLPTASTSCAYTVQALQLSIADFTIEPKDTLTWSNGTLTLTGPVAASDNGSGVAVPSAVAVLAFDVSSSSGQRVAVASGSVSLGIGPDYATQKPTGVQIQSGRFDFGGYVIDSIFLDGTLTAQ